MRLILLLICLIAAAGPARAAESAASVTKRATVSLVSDTDLVAVGQPYRVALRFRLAPGWHTYYRNPGDAGVPPDLDWTLPAGTTVGTVQWPTPQQLPEGPLMTFGYTGDLLLMQSATGPGPIRLHASWLVCNNICVPEEADFSLDLPVGSPAPSAEAALFTLAEADLPKPSPWSARITPDGTLTVSGAGATAVHAAWFLPQTGGLVAPSAPQPFVATPGGFRLKLAATEGFDKKAALAGTLIATDSSGQTSALDVIAEPGPPPAGSATGLFEAVLFALLGGLILNLMPCVFPVLAMKALAITRLCHDHRGEARRQTAVYTLGVLVSFSAIGFGILGLRQLGIGVGWGFQFQSPIFVAGMAWVLFAVGLNLSGVFQVKSQLSSAGQGLTLRGGSAGSFFSGVLATLVATPCTAPFMGLALAYALAAPPAATLAVFLAMGFGLALPTVLVVTLPGANRLIPRPGPWMDVFKQALAFPMYAAAAWLVWVVSMEAGPEGVLATTTGMVLLGFAAWALGHGRIGKVLAIAAGVAALAMLSTLTVSTEPVRLQAEGPVERFEPNRLARLRADGKPVFINMTAAWCVTCLVNERVALSPKSVQQAFAAAGVVQMKGDWTRQDPEISAFLQAQGRDGVPLYVFYPPGQRSPVVLPQLLTQATVLDAVKPYAIGLP